MTRSPLPLVLLLLVASGCPFTEKETGQEGDTGETEDTTPPSPDGDSDGIADSDEPAGDQDGDGVPNVSDDDSDGDGIPDSVEAGDDDTSTPPVDTDADGTPDFLDSDSDGNGISDTAEAGTNLSVPQDSDEDGVPDYADLDNDGDGILDAAERGTGDLAADTDQDGVPDYMDADSDGDGIGDGWEAGLDPSAPVDTDLDGVPDYRDGDSDGDGLSDAREGGLDDGATEPRDTDGDGVHDFRDGDSDGDGLLDLDEGSLYPTDPLLVDTDEDGQTDGAEVLGGSDPTDPESVLPYYVEVAAGGTGSTDFPFNPVVDRVDFAFIADTTGSMGSTLTTLVREFDSISTDLAALVADPAFAFGTYEDFNYSSYGSSTDTPFRLNQQVTTDTALVQASLNAATLRGGGDYTESTIEALYQSLTGVGYDQDCDGALDDYDDVPPFVASSWDVFGGAVEGVADPSTPGTGTLGGMGFREGSVPILIYATDNVLRDPDADYPVPTTACDNASSSDLVDQALEMGAWLVGISVTNTYAWDQMEDLAVRTGSMVDQDGDGTEDPLVFGWSSGSLADDLVPALEAVLDTLSFDQIQLLASSETGGLFITVDPEVAEGPFAPGEPVVFTVTVQSVVDPGPEWTYALVQVSALGDGVFPLGDYTLVVALAPAD